MDFHCKSSAGSCNSFTGSLGLESGQASDSTLMPGRACNMDVGLLGGIVKRLVGRSRVQNLSISESLFDCDSGLFTSAATAVQTFQSSSIRKYKGSLPKSKC